MQPLRKRKLRFFLVRWHRRIGVPAALLLILAALTGVALNHTGGLGLAQNYPQNALLLFPYRHLLPQLRSYDTPVGRLYSNNGWLMLNDTRLNECDLLTGYAATANEQLVACGSQWWLFADWQLLESFDISLSGFEASAQPGTIAGSLALSDGADWYLFDSNTLGVTQSVEAGQLAEAMVSSGDNRVISWQRLTQDLHSGRWFGAAGIWVMDAAAVVMLLLSLSGLWLWWSRPRNRL